MSNSSPSPEAQQFAQRIAEECWERCQQAASGDDATAIIDRIALYAQYLRAALAPALDEFARQAVERERRRCAGIVKLGRLIPRRSYDALQAEILSGEAP